MPSLENVRERSAEPGAEIVGREGELTALRAFAAAGRTRTLVLTGGPGIGKTTLWEAGVAAAREREMLVLSTRASDAEAQLSFAGLIDLLDDVAGDALADLPAPQRKALEVALLRAEPDETAPEPRAIALGCLHALRALAARTPVFLAIDDVQWLDESSSEVLSFVSRRLEGDALQFLVAKRPGRPSALERALEAGRIERLEVGPLSLGAIRRLLSERLGVSLPRYLLRRVVDSTLGNPLFALELAGAMAEQGLPGIGDELPVPDRVEELLGARVARLRPPVRRLLLAVALGDLRVSELETLAGAAPVEDAVDAGLLRVDGVRVRASHPLLAAAARKGSRARARRELHLQLAHVVADGELRARHLALAADRPDEELAETVAAAGEAAGGRGATREALELREHALRLTPPGSLERPQRVLRLAHYLAVAGEKQRVTDLLAAELDSLPAGAPRAQAWLIMPGGMVTTNDEIRLCLERALAESESDPVLHAAVLGNLSFNAAVIRIEQIREAETLARDALPAARRGGPEIERPVLYSLAYARSLRGCPIDDLCERHSTASDAASYLLASPARIAGLRLVWRGEIQQAQTALSRLLSLADERGEAPAYATLRFHLCELELRAGNWDAATRLLDEWAEPSEREILPWPMYERCRALLAAGRGHLSEAEQWAAETIDRAEAAGVQWDLLEALRARGIAMLLAHEPGRAAESLRRVWEHTRAEGVDEPGVFPVGPDLVEALVELGDLDEARAVTSRLRELAERHEHPWGLATTKRCAGFVSLASGSYEQAVSTTSEAVADYEQLGLRFDAARTLLGLGRGQRRLKKWGAARESLERAVALFDELGSPGWADEARSELERVGARRPQPAGELSPAERRAAELAAEGLSNKEIARALFVTVKTVETHLSRAYGKLGVRSRSQLARRLA